MFVPLNNISSLLSFKCKSVVIWFLKIGVLWHVCWIKSERTCDVGDCAHNKRNDYSNQGSKTNAANSQFDNLPKCESISIVPLLEQFHDEETQTDKRKCCRKTSHYHQTIRYAQIFHDFYSFVWRTYTIDSNMEEVIIRGQRRFFYHILIQLLDITFLRFDDSHPNQWNH